MTDSADEGVSSRLSTPIGDPGLRQLEASRRLLEALLCAGVDHLVISPGSRSTPLVLASDELDVPRTVWIDERAASFYALGLARAGGCPALLCTSGTAPAHYLPALWEARADRLVLVVLSADRPSDRVDCGAPQTIDQRALYGAAVVESRDLGEIGAGRRNERSGVRRAVDALALARHRGGPAHLNVRFRKPLQPQEISGQPAVAQGRGVDAYLHSNFVSDRDRVTSELHQALRSAKRPLVLAGPARLGQRQLRSALGQLVHRYGVPLVADWASQVRIGTAIASDEERAPVDPGLANSRLLCWPAFGELLASELPIDVRRLLQADLVVQLGRPPTATAWEPWLEEVVASGGRHLVIGDQRYDPVSTCGWWIEGSPLMAVEALLSAALREGDGEPAPTGGWAPEVVALLTAAVEAVDRAARPWGEAAVVRSSIEVIGARDEPTLLAVGNSLAIRVLDSFCPEMPSRQISVLAQRGVNGIDGVFASLAGALAGQEEWRLAVALFGDVTARHDLTSLELLQQVASSRMMPVIVVVMDNNGGRIFEQLPLARRLPFPERLDPWTTPREPAGSLGGQTRAFGCEFVRVEDTSALVDAFATATRRSGVTVIEAAVPEHGAVGSWRSLREEIEEAASARGEVP